MFVVRLAVVSGLSASLEHAAGLELEHLHGQEHWPLADGDAGRIRDALELLPGDATWLWEDSDEHWWFGAVRRMDVETHDTLVHHMLHHHGLAALLASHAEGFGDFLADFQAEERDAADLAADADTRPAKQLVLAEKAFPSIRDLRTALNQISLSGLRNLHSYDHSAVWLCRGHFGRRESALQAMASARAMDWLRAVQVPAVRLALHSEYAAFRDGIASHADFTDGRGDHVELQFLQVKGGDYPPLEEWAPALAFALAERDGKCFAEGSLSWEGLDEASRFSVELSEEDCARVRDLDQEAQKAEVSMLVRDSVYDTVARYRTALGARRGLLWAQEEASLAAHPTLGSQPRRQRDCSGDYRPSVEDVHWFVRERFHAGNASWAMALVDRPFLVHAMRDELTGLAELESSSQDLSRRASGAEPADAALRMIRAARS